MKLLLQHKIVAGYLLLMAVIGCMVAIVLHERNRVRKIENESIAIFQTQHHINTAHRYVPRWQLMVNPLLCGTRRTHCLIGTVVCERIPCCKS